MVNGFTYGNVARPRAQTTDSVPHIDIRKCKRRPDLLPEDWIFAPIGGRALGASAFYRWNTDSGPMEIMVEYPGSSSKRKIVLDFTPCRFGGRRPWFTCPGSDCGRRAAILYFHPHGLLCRKCADLSYESQYEDGLSRQLRRANKLRRRLGGRPGWANPIPEKPRYMHWTSYDRIYREISDMEVDAVYGLRNRAFAQYASALDLYGPLGAGDP